MVKHFHVDDILNTIIQDLLRVADDLSWILTSIPWPRIWGYSQNQTQNSKVHLNTQ